MEDTHLLEFRCIDIGYTCDVSLKARKEEELMRKISKHAKEHHNITNPDEETVKKIKGAIKPASEC
jgi:predicted small metal-binding protein